MAKRTLKFAPNISTLFTEFQFRNRYEMAKRFGFHAVECQYPYDQDGDFLQKLRITTDMEHVFINSYPGDISAGDLGMACVPGRELEFKHSIDKTMEYAYFLKCFKIHIMGGVMKSDDYTLEDYEAVYEINLRGAAGMFSEKNLIGLIEPRYPKAIEPLYPGLVKSYILTSFEKAVSIIKKINSPNLKLLLDLYHLKMLTDGDLLDAIRTYYPYAGHIQISQAPARYEPDFPGDIDFIAVFDLLEELGYKDYIGLEYKPFEKRTKDSLTWIKEYGFEL